MSSLSTSKKITKSNNEDVSKRKYNRILNSEKEALVIEVF